MALKDRHDKFYPRCREMHAQLMKQQAVVTALRQKVANTTGSPMEQVSIL